MSNYPPEIPSQLESAFYEHLKHGQAIQEHALLKSLTEQGFQGFKPSLDPLELFQAHFLCFHLLYRLQAKWFSAGLGWLEIYTLNIQLHPMQSGDSNALAQNDELRAYYLNYQHFINTQAVDVQNLMDNFWSQFDFQIMPSETLKADLALLEIAPETPLENLSLAQINQQYRKLCAQHHPDKGGKTSDFQALSLAANRLRKSL